MLRKLLTVGKWFLYWIFYAGAFVTLQMPITADQQNSPLIYHSFLVGWAIAVIAFVTYKVGRKTESFSKGLRDGIISGALVYAGLALLSEAVVDFALKIDISSIFSQIIFIAEVTLLFLGTVFFIRKETDLWDK